MKIVQYLQSINMKPFNRTMYYKIHTQYAVKTVEDLWAAVLEDNIAQCKDRDVILLGKILIHKIFINLSKVYTI